MTGFMYITVLLKNYCKNLVVSNNNIIMFNLNFKIKIIPGTGIK